jgi:protein OS-9
MVISTPRLCNDVAFHPPKADAPHTIQCMPVVPRESFPAYLEAKEAMEPVDPEGTPSSNQPTEIAQRIKNEFKHQVEALQAMLEVAGKDKPDNTDEKKKIPMGELEDEEKNALEAAVKELFTPKRKFVAGIEVGGKKMLPPGTRLQKGIVVGGGAREKLLATIARSDGYTANEEELAKLNIKNGKELETIKQEVERVAEGAQWQIDVVETARGKELRGIIGDPNKHKKSSKGKDETDGEDEDASEADEEIWEDADKLGEDDGSEETYKEEL